MINILITTHKGKIIVVNCSNHANGNTQEGIMVCAGVTAILTGGCNALDNTYPDDVQIVCKPGTCKIKVKKMNTGVHMVLKTIYYQLKTLNQQYHKHFIWEETTNEI